MHPKSPKWLDDSLQAADLILSATRGRSEADYLVDRLLRSAVERNFEVIGEALNRLRKTDSSTAGRIPECDAIIGFRNVLIHGYDVVDHSKVWTVIQTDLPNLRSTLVTLLAEAAAGQT